MIESRFIDIMIGLFGHRRVKFADWPRARDLDAIIDAIRGLGGKRCGEGGSPDGSFTNLYFRIGRRRVRLCIEEYDDLTLWGPKRLVGEISKRVAERLAHNDHEKGGAA